MDLEINLYNFEDDEYADSQYVLTSPRSLEACDMLGIKPAELLYKPLAEVQDEYMGGGLTIEEIYNTYNAYEQQRQQKLRQCRDYRDKMIRDQLNGGVTLYDRLDPALQDPKPRVYTQTRKNHIRTKSAPQQQSTHRDSLETWRNNLPYAHRHLQTPSPDRGHPHAATLPLPVIPVNAHSSLPVIPVNAHSSLPVGSRHTHSLLPVESRYDHLSLRVESRHAHSSLPVVPPLELRENRYRAEPLPRVNGDYEFQTDTIEHDRPLSRSLGDLRQTYNSQPVRTYRPLTSGYDYRKADYRQPERRAYVPVSRQVEEIAARAIDKYNNRYLDSPRDSAYCSSGPTQHKVESLRDDIEKWRIDAETSLESPADETEPQNTDTQNRWSSTTDRGRQFELDLLDDSWKNRLSERTRQLLESSKTYSRSLPITSYNHEAYVDATNRYNTTRHYTRDGPVELLDTADLARIERRAEMRKEELEAEALKREVNKKLKIRRGDLKLAVREAVNRRDERERERAAVQQLYREVDNDGVDSDFSEVDLEPHMSDPAESGRDNYEPNHIHNTKIKPRLRVCEQKQIVVEKRIDELKSTLADRRKRLNDKIKESALKTSVLHERKRVIEKRQKKRELRRKSPEKTPKQPVISQVYSSSNLRPKFNETFDKKAKRVELSNWVYTGQRYRSRSQEAARPANRNHSQFLIR